MRIEPLVPDSPPMTTGAAAPDSGFARTLDALGAIFSGAEKSENAFAAGSGDLQRAVYERARADVALSVAAGAAQRASQALQTILNMQV